MADDDRIFRYRFGAPKGDWKWYITPTAIRQYMEIMGLPDDAESFEAALIALGNYSLTARLIPDAKDETVALTYRSGRVYTPRRSARLEFTVTPRPDRGNHKGRTVGAGSIPARPACLPHFGAGG